MEKRNFKVSAQEEKTRLDLYLAQRNDDLTRSFIKKQIESNSVVVNGNIEFRANYPVKVDDLIEINFEGEAHPDVEPEDIDLKIIYEDDDLVVINKDSGMVVYPGSGNDSGTLVNALVSRYRFIKGVGDRLRSGLVHRLDKGTSGVILAAKSNRSLSHYTKQFAQRNVEKKYLAVSGGKVPLDLQARGSISLKNFLKRNNRLRKKFSVDLETGKFAHSEIVYLASENNNHLTEIDIKTGRTHQIRVHLSSIGMPILGDNKYGGPKYERLMLHSWKLKINLLNGETKLFEAPIPNEFSSLFENIEEIVDKE